MISQVGDNAGELFAQAAVKCRMVSAHSLGVSGRKMRDRGARVLEALLEILGCLKLVFLRTDDGNSYKDRLGSPYQQAYLEWAQPDYSSKSNRPLLGT